MDVNKALMGQDIWKTICVFVQKPKATLTNLAHKALTFPDNQGADALAQV